MKIFKPNNKNKGFTILELMVTVFVVTTGILGVYIVTSQIIFNTTLSGLRLTASYLAQEGIEIVRNMRDSNLIQNNTWNEGITGSDEEVSLGSDTKFRREITFLNELDLSNPSDGVIDIMTVRVEVSWNIRGKTHEIVVQENLYNLRP